MAWSPVREPLVGSASSGQPASWASTRAGGPASSPATTTVRGPAGSSTGSARSSHDMAQESAATSVHGPSGSSGSSRWTLRWTGPSARRQHAADGRAARLQDRRRGEGAEDPHLVGGLVGAGAAHPRRPVGGDDDQVEAGVGGLHDGGQEVGHGRPGGAHDGRAGAHLGEPEREEAGGALVDPGVQAQQVGPGRVVDREGQRRVARAGAEDDLAHPAPRAARSRRRGPGRSTGSRGLILPHGRQPALPPGDPVRSRRPAGRARRGRRPGCGRAASRRPAAAARSPRRR